MLVDEVAHWIGFEAKATDDEGMKLIAKKLEMVDVYKCI